MGDLLNGELKDFLKKNLKLIVCIIFLVENFLEVVKEIFDVIYKKNKVVIIFVFGIIGIGGVGKFFLVDELVCWFFIDFLEKIIVFILVDFFKRKIGGVLLGDCI